MGLKGLLAKIKHPAKSKPQTEPTLPLPSTTPSSTSPSTPNVVNAPAGQSTMPTTSPSTTTTSPSTTTTSPSITTTSPITTSTSPSTTTTPPNSTAPAPINASPSRTLFETFQLSLTVLRNAPLPGAKLAADAVLELLRHTQDLALNQEGFRSLASQMEWLLFLADKHKVDNVDNVLSSLINDLTRDIQELQKQLPKDAGRMKSFINSDYFKTRLAAVTGDLKTATERFQLELQITTSEDISRLREELKDLKETPNSSNTSRNGELKQTLRNLNLDAKRSISGIAAGRNVEQVIADSNWKTDGDIVIKTTAGY